MQPKTHVDEDAVDRDRGRSVVREDFGRPSRILAIYSKMSDAADKFDHKSGWMIRATEDEGDAANVFGRPNGQTLRK